jgi:hypothetical protein
MKAWEMLSVCDWDMNKAIDLLEQDREDEQTNRYTALNALNQQIEAQSNPTTSVTLYQNLANNLFSQGGSGIGGNNFNL